MANGNHVSGGKLTGNHTTVNGVAKILILFVGGLQNVGKISIGMLINKAGGGGVPTVKLTRESAGCILAVCIQAGSVSEVRIYACRLQETMEALARFVRNSGWKLRFRKAE